MTTIFALIISGLVALGVDGAYMSPETRFEMSGGTPPPSCREANQSELAEHGVKKEGKASTFILEGRFICERAIFEYGERNSFDTFVADQTQQRADEVALRVSNWLQAYKASGASTGIQSIFVDLSSDRPESSAAIVTCFQNALVSRVQAIKVLHQKSHIDESTLVLHIVVRHVDDPSQVLGASLVRKTSGGTKWVEL